MHGTEPGSVDFFTTGSAHRVPAEQTLVIDGYHEPETNLVYFLPNYRQNKSDAQDAMPAMSAPAIRDRGGGLKGFKICHS